MKRLRNFMNGRYGYDQLNKILIVIYLIIYISTFFIRNYAITVITYIPLIFAFYRIFSKDIEKRTQENFRFIRGLNLMKSKLRNLCLILIGTKTHKYFLCSRCRQTIRIPKGKGKICITCPKCRMEFVKRT